MSKLNWADGESDDEGALKQNVTSKVINEVTQEAKLEHREPSNKRDHSGGKPFHQGGHQYKQLPTIPKDGPTPFVILVTSLDYNATEDDVGNFFCEGGCNVAEVILNPENCKGTCLVYFSDAGSLSISYEGDRREILGRQIRVKGQYTKYENSDRKPNYDRPHQRQERTERVYDRIEKTNDRPQRVYERSERPQRNFERPFEKPLQSDHRRQHRSSEYIDESNSSSDKQINSIVSKESEKHVVPLERPKLNLAPRTVPIEDIGKPVVASSIFGDGKPRDAFVHEKLVPEDSKSNQKNSNTEIPTEKGRSKGQDKYKQDASLYRASHRSVSVVDDSKPEQAVGSSPSASIAKKEDGFEEVLHRKDTSKKHYVVEELKTSNDSRGGRGGRGRGSGRGDRLAYDEKDKSTSDRSGSKGGRADRREGRGPGPKSNSQLSQEKELAKPKELKAESKSAESVHHKNAFGALDSDDESH